MNAIKAKPQKAANGEYLDYINSYSKPADQSIENIGNQDPIIKKERGPQF